MTDHPQAADNIEIRVYDVADAPTHEATRTATADPKHKFQTHNTTRGGYHEAIVGALNGITPDITADALALGDATTATASIPDGQALGNELFRVPITDTFTDGQTFNASIFLDSTQATGLSFEEAALVAEQSGSDIPLNRFLITDPGGLLDPKTSNETVTIDISITQQDG